MKEAIILIFVACSSIFILGYSIHMLIGGLVSEEVELWTIGIGCALGTGLVAFMAWDILRQRRLR